MPVKPQQDVFQHGEVMVDLGCLKGPANAESGDLMGRESGQCGRSQLDGALFRFEEPGDDIQQGGLTGTVGADEGDDFPRMNGQIHFIEGLQAAERQGDILHRQERWFHPGWCRFEGWRSGSLIVVGRRKSQPGCCCSCGKPPGGGCRIIRGGIPGVPSCACQLNQSWHQSLTAEDQDPGQDESIDQDVEVFKPMEHCRQAGQQHGAGQAAPDASHASHHHHGEDLDGIEDIESLGADEGDVVSVTETSQGGVQSAQHKGGHLVAEGGNTQRLCRQFLLVDGPEGAADAGVDQIDGQGEHDQKQGPDEIVEASIGADRPRSQMEPGNAWKARRAAGDAFEMFQQDAHDDIEPQGGHNQVVAFEPQGRQGEQKADAAGQGHGKEQGGGQRPLPGSAGDGREVGAHGIKGGMAEGNLAGGADEQIEAEDHQGIERHDIEEEQKIVVGHGLREEPDGGRQYQQSPPVPGQQGHEPQLLF